MHISEPNENKQKKYANGFNSVYIIDVQLRWKNLMEKEKWKNKRRRGKKCAFIFNLVQPKKKNKPTYTFKAFIYFVIRNIPVIFDLNFCV